jgi:hypothetical protein
MGIKPQHATHLVKQKTVSPKFGFQVGILPELGVIPHVDHTRHPVELLEIKITEKIRTDFMLRR